MENNKQEGTDYPNICHTKCLLNFKFHDLVMPINEQLQDKAGNRIYINCWFPVYRWLVSENR